MVGEVRKLESEMEKQRLARRNKDEVNMEEWNVNVDMRACLKAEEVQQLEAPATIGRSGVT